MNTNNFTFELKVGDFLKSRDRFIINLIELDFLWDYSVNYTMEVFIVPFNGKIIYYLNMLNLWYTCDMYEFYYNCMITNIVGKSGI